MPNLKSQAKRLRQTPKRTSLNRFRKNRLKIAENDFDEAVEKKDVSAAQEALSACFAALDRAAKRNTISKNRASRKKSRLTKRLEAI